MSDDVRLDGPQTAAQAGVFTTRAEVALHGVYEISKVLAIPARLETTLSNVLTLLSSFLDMSHGLIALLNEQGEPDVVVGSGWSLSAAQKYFDSLPERAIGQIVATRMPLVVENVEADPLFTGWRGTGNDPRQSFIGVPIKMRDKVIGTLTIDRVRDGSTSFSFDEDVRFLSMIANLVGQTVRLHDVIHRDRERLMDEQRRLEKELSQDTRATMSAPAIKGRNNAVGKARGIIGDSDAIHNVLDKVHIVARSNSTVLLRGESGTGKELFARAIHDLSDRSKGPFIKLNCAALPESVLESELFGHEKGAFTGAVNQRKGRFELAHGGTLFLDEIGEISASFQAKLLRVLQEGEFERVGGMKTIRVDVRLVTATNRDLEAAVVKGDFRADLYYRINVISLQLPPLRDRREDVLPLAGEFLHRFNNEHGTKLSFARSARQVLEGCFFPGNVRELENCVRRTATLARHDEIVADDFACRNDDCLSSTLWKGAVRTAGAFNIISRTPSGGTMVTPAGVPEPPRGPVGGFPNSEAINASVARARTLNGGNGAANGHGPNGAAAREVAEDRHRASVPAGPWAASAPESGTEASFGSDCPGPDSAACLAARNDAASERDRLVQAMEQSGWVQAKAARLLNLTPRQIGYALRKHNIPIKKF